MTSFADINWLAWQLPEREALDACKLKVITGRMVVDSDINLVHGAIRELERRVAALEAKQPLPTSDRPVWKNYGWDRGANYSLRIDDGSYGQYLSN